MPNGNDFIGIIHYLESLYKNKMNEIIKTEESSILIHQKEEGPSLITEGIWLKLCIYTFHITVIPKQPFLSPDTMFYFFEKN